MATSIKADFVQLFQSLGLEHITQHVLVMLTPPRVMESLKNRVGQSLTEARLVSNAWHAAVARLVFATPEFNEFYLQRCEDLMNGALAVLEARASKEKTTSKQTGCVDAVNLIRTLADKPEWSYETRNYYNSRGYKLNALLGRVESGMGRFHIMTRDCDMVAGLTLSDYHKLWPPNCDSCQISISGSGIPAMASSPSPSSSATSSGSTANSTFFCHGCKHRIPNVTQDFTCPRPGCNSGFVEEMSVSEARESQARENPARSEFHHADPGARFFEQLIGSVIMDSFTPQPQLGQPRRAGGGGGSHGIHFQGVGGGGLGGIGAQPFLQDLLQNLAGIQGDEGHHIQLIPGGFQMYSNPGDYAWGRGGLDAIVTQLLNQMDGAGPPPMQKADIASIPSIQVTQQNADDKVQCSVCWEDFVVGETVRKLNCDHIFHSDCIVPWLELHSTCPVCRKSQAQGGEGGAEHQGENTPMDQDEAEAQSANGVGAEQQSHPSFGNTMSSVFSFLGSTGHASQPQQPSTSTSTSASGAAAASSPSSSAGRANGAERAAQEAPDKHESFRDLDLE